jgi:catechol 2,3-dioxygenase-like lactoylglutathione lyase family enzyme
MKTKLVLAGFIAVVCLAASAFLRRGAPPANTAVSRPPILGIANIALRVGDAAQSQHFFGHVLGFDALPLNETAKGKMRYTYFKVNDYQYIKVSPTLSSPAEDGLIHIAFRTSDVRALGSYLAAHGVTVPASLQKDAEGDLSFNITDPVGHQVQFIQYLPGSVESRNTGKYLAPGRVSHEIIHAGETVPDRAAVNRLYGGILGYREMWQGGMTDNRTDWVDMVVPNGQNWLEYMLHVNNPSARQRGVMDHFSLGVKSVQQVYATIKARGLENSAKPQLGRDGKWQLNLYDQALTRVEIMDFKPVEKPCCSPMKTFR